MEKLTNWREKKIKLPEIYTNKAKNLFYLTGYFFRKYITNIRAYPSFSKTCHKERKNK